MKTIQFLLKGFGRFLIYTIIVTTILTRMDWDPIHRSWQEHQYFPDESVYAWWQQNADRRMLIGYAFGSWNMALAEHYYFALFEIEAGIQERGDLLLNHAPYSYNLFLPDGPYMWLGQGGEGNNNPWKRISVLAWWVYWLPSTTIWLVLFGEIFWLRLPWWLKGLLVFRKRHS